jgi:hypothetical protein
MFDLDEPFGRSDDDEEDSGVHVPKYKLAELSGVQAVPGDFGATIQENNVHLPSNVFHVASECFFADTPQQWLLSMLGPANHQRIANLLGWELTEVTTAIEGYKAVVARLVPAISRKIYERPPSDPEMTAVGSATKTS